MPRDISAPMLTELSSNVVYLACLVEIDFKSTTEYVWTGVGDIVFGGHTYGGVGDLGEIGPITEGVDVQAYGTTLSLSGIDATILAESLADIQLMAPVNILLATFDAACNLVGTPYKLFAGRVGKPTVSPGTKNIRISIAVETRLKNLQRPSMRRYTSADQNLYFPGDTFFLHVAEQVDLALKFTP